MRIGVTDNQKANFDLYVQWLKRGDPGAEIVKLSYLANNVAELDTCDGLMLTGGGDVDPMRYNKPEAKGEVRDVDKRRDEFEFDVIKRAMDLRTPLLGICRGLQMTNVALGGSLIIDLVSNGYRSHRGNGELLHRIDVLKDTLLSRILGSSNADVNSAHHQAVDTVAAGLRISARSEDGVVEALEWMDPAGKPFLMLVQWHPERMRDQENIASRKILHAFLNEVSNVARGNRK
jgi:putative glutamine amidotransferase